MATSSPNPLADEIETLHIMTEKHMRADPLKKSRWVFAAIIRVNSLLNLRQFGVICLKATTKYNLYGI